MAKFKEKLEKAKEKTVAFAKKAWKPIAAAGAIAGAYFLGRKIGYDEGEFHNPDYTPDGCEDSDFSWNYAKDGTRLEDVFPLADGYGERELKPWAEDHREQEVIAIGVFTKRKEE